MNAFIFGLIFIQVSIFFIAGLLLMTILFRKMANAGEKASAPVFENRIRARRIRA